MADMAAGEALSTPTRRPRRPRGYAIKKVYFIVCEQCNEDITRAQSEDEPTTRAEAEEWIREHDRTWHDGAEELAGRGKKYPPEPLTRAEFDLLVAQCSQTSAVGIRNRALLTLAYGSGLRISELLSLRPADVTFGQHTLRLLDTKTGVAQTRGFHPITDDALSRWMEYREGLGFGNGPLFCTRQGGPVSDTYVRAMMKRLGAQAGIEKRVHPHGLRHTFAMELDARGTPIAMISKLMGHQKVPTTAQYLDHLTNRQAVDALLNVDLPPLGSPDS